MSDAKFSAIPLLAFDRIDEVSKRSSIVVPVDEPDNNIDNLRSIIHQHAREGNADAAETLLNKHPDLVNTSDFDGLTALHYAAKYGNLKVIELLLNRGADVDAVSNRDQYTPLHMVAKYCRSGSQQQRSRKSLVSKFIDASARRAQSLPTTDRSPTTNESITAIVNLLVKRGAIVDHVDVYGMSPLHHAAMKNNEFAARALITNGARVNKGDKNGTIPLLMASVHGSDELVRLLLSAGADCLMVDKRKNSVYHIAALHGKNDTLQLLIQYGRESAKKLFWTSNGEGKTPLHLAVDQNHPTTVATILSMKSDGAEVNEKDKWLLHNAAGKGYLEVVKTLIENGYDVRLQDNEMKLPLHVAARSNRADVVRYLLELAPDTIDVQDEYGMTPFLIAVSMNALDAVKVLVEYEADIYEIDPDGRTPVFIGAKYNATNVLLYLLELYRQHELETEILCTDVVNQHDHNQITPMHLVCYNGYMEMVTLLREYGARIDIMNEDEEIPLHLAAATGQTACVRQLLEWDKRLVMHRDENANTPLHIAAREGHEVTTKVLIDAGSDVQAKNSREETALDCAVAAGQLDTVTVLLHNGAVIENKGDERYSTPLHLAAAKGYDAIVRLLLNYRATIDRRDENGNTALDLAILNGHRTVAQVLVESDDWRAVMAPTDSLPVGRHNLTRMTPMRKLICKFPDIAEMVFDKCVESSTDNPKDYLYCVRYDFELLDDTYMMPSKDGTELVSTISPYTDTGILKKGAQAYSDDYDVVYRNHPLKIMAEAEKLSLLSHPLVFSLLKYKWNSLGRYVYYFALIVYIIFICLFTLYITYTPAPFNVFDESSKEIVDLSAILSTADAACPKIKLTRQPWLVSVKWAVISFAIIQLLKEFFQLITRRLRYITYDNAIECFVYTSAIIVVTDTSPCSEETGLRMNWQWLLAAVCAFLAWMNLLLLIRKLPRFGIYVVMFFDILRTFSRFFLIFVLFIVSFSISFYVIMQNRPEFSSVPSAVLKTAVMMIGEFEFTAIFHGDVGSHPERLFGHAVAYPLFLFFCIIMTILLMNLLVGLAVDDIKSVQEKAELKRLSMQVDLVLQVEASMPYIRKLTCKSLHTVFPNQKTFLKRLRSRFGFEFSDEAMIDEEWKESEELTSAFRQELQSQSAQLRILQSNVDNMYERQVRTEAMIRAVLKQLKIDFEEFDAK
ncbi:hypothetical protein RB195_000627 [Necator americanus]|uniref:Ion transport domain-containing protein n=1 Tax=Necator americanus TaxID=51031 RepID=A0ABR1DAM6_NECAM